MAVTITPEGGGWDIALSANGDEVVVDLTSTQNIEWLQGVRWQRSSAVALTIRVTLFPDEGRKGGGAGDEEFTNALWFDHPSTAVAGIELDPLAGLRFRRTGSAGSRLFVTGALRVRAVP